MVRNSWNIPDPKHILDADKDVRRRIEAYAKLNGLTLAEALARIIDLANI
jgi:hypothetical protein